MRMLLSKDGVLLRTRMGAVASTSSSESIKQHLDTEKSRSLLFSLRRHDPPRAGRRPPRERRSRHWLLVRRRALRCVQWRHPVQRCQPAAFGAPTVDTTFAAEPTTSTFASAASSNAATATWSGSLATTFALPAGL